MAIYRCEPCKYVTVIKCHYEKHLETEKHKGAISLEKDTDKYICRHCDTKCSFRQSYERHRKYNCKILNIQLENIKEKFNEVLNRMLTLGVDNDDILDYHDFLGQTIEHYKETRKN
jgi:hypothetical protein